VKEGGRRKEGRKEGRKKGEGKEEKCRKIGRWRTEGR
jgi:hypothetical protein